MDPLGNWCPQDERVVWARTDEEQAPEQRIPVYVEGIDLVRVERLLFRPMLVAI